MIVQQRHIFRGSKADTQAVYDALELPLEDDGVPLAVSEIDEDRDLFEVSVYVEEDDQRIAGLINELASAAVPSAHFEIEELPDVDWVTRSLKGLKPVRAGRFLVFGAHDRDKLLPSATLASRSRPARPLAPATTAPPQAAFSALVKSCPRKAA
jgi:ribosomal protein L11 methyltransferase